MHVGDDVIVTVAECMAKALPAGALSARISGDRLAALIPSSSMDAAALVAEKIRAAAAAIVPRAGQGSFEVSACLGVAPIGRSDNPLAHALATAEIACKAAKDRGRNRVEMFQDSDQSIIRRHTDILVIGKLRDALDNDSFRLDAQPILPLRGNYGRPRFELLIRMLPERGEIIPLCPLFSAAERYSAHAPSVTVAVQRTAPCLGEHRASVGQYKLALRHQPVRPIAARRGVSRVRGRSDQGEQPAARSPVFRTDRDGNHRQSGQGAEFHSPPAGSGLPVRAWDDFGTGVSSAGVPEGPVGRLSEDRRHLLSAMPSPNSRSESMIKAIAQLAKVNVHVQTIAEYVETDVLRARMADLGVDYGQGFAMGQGSAPSRKLLRELAIYEATVSDWAAAPESAADGGSQPDTRVSAVPQRFARKNAHSGTAPYALMCARAARPEPFSC